MREIYHCLWIDVHAEKVYKAVTEKSGLAGWWTKNLEAQPVEGSISSFRFGSGAFNKMKVKNLDLNKVEWECVDGHPEWKNTKISFELHAEDNKTKLIFSHYGWPRQSEFCAECNFIWAYYLQSLKDFCETGKGTPNPGN